MNCECVNGWIGIAVDGPIFCRKCLDGLNQAIKWWSVIVFGHEATLALINEHKAKGGWKRDAWRASEENALANAINMRERFEYRLQQFKMETALPVQHRTGRAVLFKS